MALPHLPADVFKGLLFGKTPPKGFLFDKRAFSSGKRAEKVDERF